MYDISREAMLFIWAKQRREPFQAEICALQPLSFSHVSVRSWGGLPWCFGWFACTLLSLLHMREYCRSLAFCFVASCYLRLALLLLGLLNLSALWHNASHLVSLASFCYYHLWMQNVHICMKKEGPDRVCRENEGCFSNRCVNEEQTGPYPVERVCK